MEVTIKKWGNSYGIRIPKNVLNRLKLKEGDILKLDIYNDQITLSKPEKITIAERIGNYKGSYDSKEYWDPRDVVGKEVW